MWGIPTLTLLLFFGIYFSHKSGFYRLKAVKKTFNSIISTFKTQTNNGISPLSAVATALGGTVGVGSIIGVGYALSVGGPGSIFWMWVCSFFGMGLKYAEVKIALNRRMNTRNGFLGGAPFRLKEQGFGFLAVVFCIFCVAASFGTGNLTQVGAISGFLTDFGMPKEACAVICCLIIALAVFGGRGRIARLNGFLIPVSSAVYLAACLCIIILNRRGLPEAFASIFKNAFGYNSISGGFSGATLAFVIREGFARSLFSNEAGMGSSPLAHATAESDPNLQAHWGIFEIFFDTFVVSGLTAFCLLSAGKTNVADIFSQTFGNIGVWGFGLLTAVFAFASVISWCYYAECCISFLFPESKIPFAVYRTLFALAAAFGVYLSDNLIWEISDVLNALMMFPNLFLLFKCRKEIERIDNNVVSRRP